MSVSLLPAPALDLMDLAILKRLPSPEVLIQAAFLRGELRRYKPWESLSSARFSYRMKSLSERGLIERAMTGKQTVGYRITVDGVKECSVADEFIRALDSVR